MSEAAQSADKSRKILLDAQVAFERGDFATVRARARRLLTTSDTPEEVKKDATELLHRIGHDKAAVYLTLGCLLLFAVVVYQYVL